MTRRGITADETGERLGETPLSERHAAAGERLRGRRGGLGRVGGVV